MKQGSIGTGKKVGELLGYRNGEDGGTNCLLVSLLSIKCFLPPGLPFPVSVGLCR